MKLIYILSICLFFTSNLLLSQVKVTTTNDYKFYGVIAEESTDTLKLYTADKLQLIIPKKNIQFIEQIKCYIKQNQSESYYGRFSSFSEKGITMECEDGAIRQFDFYLSKLSFEGSNNNNKEYAFFGITAPMPGGINLHFGRYLSENVGVAFSIGALALIEPDVLGFQGTFLYSLDRGKYLDHNLGVGLGFMSLNSQNWTGLNLTYDVNFIGFFLQPGISIGSGSFSNPQIWLQFGYVYRFND